MLRPGVSPAPTSRRPGRLRDTLAFRTLAAAARLRPGFDGDRCRLGLDFLSAAHAVRNALRRQLAEFGLTESKFSALVVLFALDPAPVTATDLAAHAGTARSGIGGAIADLESRGLVRRTKACHDRRAAYVALTARGRETTDAALTHFLQGLATVAGPVRLGGRQSVAVFCHQLEAGCNGPDGATLSSSTS